MVILYRFDSGEGLLRQLRHRVTLKNETSSKIPYRPEQSGFKCSLKGSIPFESYQKSGVSSTAIIRLNFDLVRDVEAHIGSVCGKYRSYSQADVSEILECVAQKMERENQRLSNIGAFDEVSPEELVQFDITFSGRVHPGVFGSISVNLSKWDDVAGFELVQPYEVPYRVFPLPVGMPEKMEYLV